MLASAEPQGVMSEPEYAEAVTQGWLLEAQSDELVDHLLRNASLAAETEEMTPLEVVERRESPYNAADLSLTYDASSWDHSSLGPASGHDAGPASTSWRCLHECLQPCSCSEPPSIESEGRFELVGDEVCVSICFSLSESPFSTILSVRSHRA